ncbi:MAG: homoserine O-succinyltransferase [Coriobacteriales bacterium]|jgi:homoserine O-succinyltransferase|nr:homoserine O-succinyltransferase [Coriobacteriales bacterium]
MPVNVADGLPAIDTLREENVFLMTERRAATQDIRPLEIAIVNLMPTKVATETQLLRLLSNTPLQIHVTLVSIGGHVSRNTAAGHMEAFYRDSRSIRDACFDGLIVTGAPVETLPFRDVDYWDELVSVLDWAQENVYSSLFICWGVNAALHHFYGIEKRRLDRKLFGIFPLRHRDEGASRLLLGLDDPFFMPQSRYTTVLPEDVEPVGLRVLAESPEAGAVVIAAPDHRQVFVTGHLEYDADTLGKEYARDVAAGLDIALPVNYYADDDPSKPPLVRWRTYAHQFFANWLNHYVYQETPFDLSRL